MSDNQLRMDLVGFARALGGLLVGLGLIQSTVTLGAVVTLEAAQDNTLYEDGLENVGNGAGDYLFTGRTDQGDIRRALVRFDVAGSIPPGAVINSASLQLYMSRTQSSTGRTTYLHRSIARWGEGTSDAPGEEGGGTAPSTGEATWFYRFFPDSTWTTPGGDYAPGASASTSVGGNGNYTWASATMTADVQSWRDGPENNHGWEVIGNETSNTTTKRFNSRSVPAANQRPRLTITYTPNGGIDAGACCLSTGTCIILTPADCANRGGTYQGDDTTCTTDPCGGVPVTILITTSHDNTLYEDPSGAVSNGAGEFFFTGQTSSFLKRRSVIAFDLQSQIPPGAMVTDATLTLRTTQGGSAANDVKLHRTLMDWGEGASDAPGDEWVGAPSAPGDATWIHTFFPNGTWTSAGSDYDPLVSATAYVAFESVYSWSSVGMVDDLQSWVQDPATNFGWVMIGQETGMVTTQKRYASREHADPSYRPVLEITYAIPPDPPMGACCYSHDPCALSSAADCSAAGGSYQGDGVLCTPATCEIVLEPYVDALPIPPVATPTSGQSGGTASYEIPIVEIQQQLHRDLPPTTVWAYDGVFPGPTIEASVEEPVTLTWVNDLRDSTGTLRSTHLLPVDLCLHGPDKLGPTPRTVVHLHGGHVPAEFDGYPEDTILPGEEQTFVYPNRQLPSMLWYHDHALGITRLNVLLGLAGCYIIRDAEEAALGLPDGEFEIPLVIQDRTFHEDGSLAYPDDWAEHFFGDKTLVNGKVWPYLEVRRGAYRFRVLNGANSRTYTLSLSDGSPLVVIGSDGGLLPAPVVVDSLTLAPAERADVIIDFSAAAPGTEILLRNTAPAPYPTGSPMQAQVGPVMKFIVTLPGGSAWTPPDSLRTMEELQESSVTESRDFTLQKFSDPCTGTIWLINGKHWPDIEERPWLGSTETWRFINRSGMAHPMHMHLVMFQVLDIQPFTVVADSIMVTGPPVPPEETQAGWKDTVPVLPNQMVRVIARFEDYTGLFPYHCHTLEHEDHDMMRQFEVVDTTTTAGEVPSAAGLLRLSQSQPNPAIDRLTIAFALPEDGRTRIDVYDVGGRHVATALDATLAAGNHVLRWEGRDDHGNPLPPGVYLYRLTSPQGAQQSRKLLLLD